MGPWPRSISDVIRRVGMPYPFGEIEHDVIAALMRTPVCGAVGRTARANRLTSLAALVSIGPRSRRGGPCTTPAGSARHRRIESGEQRRSQSVIRLEIPGKGSYDSLEASSVPSRLSRLAEALADLHPCPIDSPGGER